MRKLMILLATVSLLATACGETPATDTTDLPTTTTPITTTTSTATSTTEPPTTTLPETTSTAAPQESDVIVYFMVAAVDDGTSPHLVPVYRGTTDGDPAVEAIRQLIAGPTEDETSGTPAISSAVPADSELLSLNIDDGTATVDLSAEFAGGGGTLSMAARLAQLVYTVTDAADVEQVVLELDGEPVEVFSSEGIIIEGPLTRDGYVDLLPAIFVDSPAWGEPVQSPVMVAGVANVFEATFQMLLTDDDGAPLFEQTVTASCGTGCWGEFEVEIPYEIDREQFGALIVWEDSAKDGSRTNINEYPVQLR